MGIATFLIVDPQQDGEMHLLAYLLTQFSKVQRIYRDFLFIDNIEIEKLVYRRPASGRFLRTFLAASVLGISKRDSALAHISCVDHERLADEFIRLDALD